MSAAPDPGRFPSLGEEVDLADARAIVQILQGCLVAQQDPHPRRSAANKLARWTISELWDAPRLRALRQDGDSYGRWPRSFPWSPGAVAVFTEHPAAPPPAVLVFEHLIPAKLSSLDLLARIGEMNAADLIDHLNTRNLFAIITREEDRRLSAASLHSSSPDVTDPWARYRGLPDFPEPESFTRLPA